MNELSVEVECAAPPCALAVGGTAGTNFVYFLHASWSNMLLLGGATSSSILRGGSEIE
jgi:hypothetical protein